MGREVAMLTPAGVDSRGAGIRHSYECGRHRMSGRAKHPGRSPHGATLNPHPLTPEDVHSGRNGAIVARDNAAPTKHQDLIAWVDEIAELTEPDEVVWCDGSERGVRSACARSSSRRAPSSGSTRRSAPTPSTPPPTPSDVARVEDRTFICSEREEDAGPTNNWKAPAEMRQIFTADEGLFGGSMRGRTMYVVPFCMGPLGSPLVRARRRDHRLRLRRALDADHDPDGPRGARRARHRRLLRQGRAHRRRAAGPGPGRRAVAVQPDQVHLPLPRETARSGPTAPATAATRCSARSATRCASPPSWPATRAGSPSTC